MVAEVGAVRGWLAVWGVGVVLGAVATWDASVGGWGTTGRLVPVFVLSAVALVVLAALVFGGTR